MTQSTDSKFCLDREQVYTQLVALSDDGNTMATIVGEIGASAFDWSSTEGWKQRSNSTISSSANKIAELNKQLR